mmetsp:Transcript_1364/g.2234  ORF Transcript_1364/g.2234 Transcript_1364/m.2234 type:complete len:109 (-) Transcript_1364:285-611(-)
MILANAFKYCSSLKSITIPTSVFSIESSAFEYSALVNVVIPTSVGFIGITAFASCKSLASITIPTSVYSIGDRAFAYSYNTVCLKFDPWKYGNVLGRDVFASTYTVAC